MPRTLDSEDAPAASSDGSAHRDLSAMIDAGRAFSGHERNCIFLNTRDGRFADLSGGSGLDFPDDGRAVAVSDWDQDGDLDLWISNRNAPRLRLMRNDGAAKNHYLALRLSGSGNGNNRDAIGARVEVLLDHKASTPRLVQSLRAGEGFLSQSSKWLHFGLGKHSELAEVRVRWPDGSEESFSGLASDRRYRLVQGSGQATPVAARTGTLALKPSAAPVATSSEAARIPVVTLLRAPRMNLKDRTGRPAGTGSGSGRNLLVNFWATWCAPCKVELTHLRDREADLRGAGLDVLALSVDGLGVSPGNGADPAKVLSALRFPFPSSRATEPLFAAFQEFHDHLVGLNRPLPVPTSFLIDPRGHIAVIYKGPLDIDQLLADLHHTEGSVDQRLMRSAQVPGSLIANPLVAKSRLTHEASIQYRYGLARRVNNDSEGAAYYLSAARRLDPEFPPAAKELADLHLSQRDWTKAAAEFEAYLALQSDDGAAHRLLAQVRARLGQSDDARTHFEEALRLEPDASLSHFEFAAFLAAHGDPKKAVSHYRSGLKLEPANRVAANNLAWLLATHPSDDVREPEQALRQAITLNQATGGQIPNILDTLAAAQAGLGDYPSALATARRALELAETQGNLQLAAGLKRRLALYEQGKPFREAATAANP